MFLNFEPNLKHQSVNEIKVSTQVNPIFNLTSEKYKLEF